MLNLKHTLLILTFLFFLVVVISTFKWMIGWCIRVKESNIKKERSNFPLQKPLAAMSSRVLESEFAI